MTAYHIRILAGRIDRGAGSHVYHQELVRRLVARGHRVSLVCFTADPDVPKGVDVTTIPRADQLPGPFWRFSPLHDVWHSFRELAQTPLKPADVVIGGEHLFLRAHAWVFPKTPWIYLPHSLVVDQEIRSYRLPKVMGYLTERLYTWMQRWALQHASRTMRFTDVACEALKQRYPTIPARFVVNPAGTDLTPLTLKPDAPLCLLAMGRLIPSKRLDVALDALARAKHQDWTLDIVGDGTCRAALEAQAERLHLADRVHFHGFQDHPSAWYERAHLLLFPSELESFSLTLIEAMSHGVPCVAMRGDGVTYRTASDEIVTHGQNGFLADSADAFAQQLEHLLSHPSALRLAGALAWQTVRDRYTWDRHLDRLEETFDTLTGLEWPADIQEVVIGQ